MDDRFRVQADAVRAVGRMGGLDYVRTADRLELPWGAAALRGGT